MIKTPAQYTAYFKALQENHKQINGFYRITFTGDLETDRLLLRDFLTEQKDLKLPCMLRVLFTGNFVDNNSENRLQDTKGAFVLLDVCDDRGDFDRQEAIFNNTYQWGLQMMAYIKKDIKLNQEGWLDIQFENFDFDFIGPLLNRFYGCMFNFSYLVVVNGELQYNSSHEAYWNDPL